MSEGVYSVAIESAPETVQAGESVDVAVVVTNDGDEEGEPTVELLNFDGEGVDSEDCSLAPGEAETVELSWTPDADAVGEGNLTVTADGAQTKTRLIIEDAPASFAVELTEVPEFVSAGSTASIVATVENTGTLSGTQDIVIDIDEETVETKSAVDLAGGATETVEYSHEPEDVGEFSVEVSSDDDSASATVNVVTPMVTGVRSFGSKSGMGIFGWLMFIGMAILLLPLLPIYAVLKLLDLVTRGESPVP